MLKRAGTHVAGEAFPVRLSFIQRKINVAELKPYGARMCISVTGLSIRLFTEAELGNSGTDRRIIAKLASSVHMKRRGKNSSLT